MQFLQAPLGIAAGCAIAMTLPLVWSPSKVVDPTEELRGGETIAELRARGPSVLPALIDRFEHMPNGPGKDAAERVIDQVAGQRYATVSKLYWYTDLAAAQTAARDSGKPLLSLRMLGHLDEDLSCANSRLFRATLYANAQVSKLLRDKFILHWSNERDVPQVTIDFGDGRRLERTTTGNSAHFVLDSDGNVIDVLPGLYAPATFIQRLGEDISFIARARGMNEDYRTLITRHAEQIAWALERWSWNPDDPSGTMVARAQRITVGKGMVERRDLRAYARETYPGRDDSEGWVAYGAKKYDVQLDASSRALVERIFTAGYPATRPQLAAMERKLERSIGGDTALNEVLLRPQIARLIANGGGRLTLDQLIPQVYDKVFHTPRADAWLGLLPRTDFTGIPGDGVHIDPLAGFGQD